MQLENQTYLDDRHPKKDEIIRILKKTDWKEKMSRIAMARLKQYMIFDELKRNGIKELDEGSIFDL